MLDQLDQTMLCPGSAVSAGHQLVAVDDLARGDGQVHAHPQAISRRRELHGERAVPAGLMRVKDERAFPRLSARPLIQPS